MSSPDPRHAPTARNRSWPPPADEVSFHASRRYALQGEIASGSLCTVHLGRLLGPERFERTVAVKRLRPSYAKDTECVEMLLEGARLAARVRHPNVAPALDVVTSDEVLVVAEYVHGESLAALLRTERGRGTQAPLGVVSSVIAGVLRGLDAVDAVRAASPVRTVRPAAVRPDVVVGTDGVARLVDLVGRAGADAAVTIGPPDASDRDASGIFGAAVLLWEAIAGRLFLPRAPDGFDPPSRYRAGLAPEVDTVVAKGLASAPAPGFASAGDMARALETALPPATAAQVGAWVESLAREALEARTRLLAAAVDAERGALPAPPLPVATVSGRPRTATNPPPSPAAVTAGEVVTRRLRSTPPPPATEDVAPSPGSESRADHPPPGRSHRPADAFRRRRVAILAAGVAGPTLLVAVCALSSARGRPTSVSVPAATTGSAVTLSAAITAPAADPVAPSPAAGADEALPTRVESPPPPAPPPPSLPKTRVRRAPRTRNDLL